MVKNFNDFVGNKKVQNNRSYENLYAKNIPTIIILLEECKKNRHSHEDMYEVLEMREVTEESLRKIVKRIAIANDLEF